MSKSLSSLFITLAASALVLAAPAAHADKIKIATEGAYAPFNYIDASGKPGGFDVDLALALCEKMQAECEIVTQNWDGIIPGLQSRRYDAISASMSITAERQRAVAFTDPVYSNILAWIAAKDQTLTTDKDGLKGKTIGAQRATVAGQYLEDQFGDSITIKLYDTQDNAYLDLAANRLDGLLSDKFPAYGWLQSEAGANFEFKGKDIDSQDKIGIALRKEDTELRERFNKAIAAVLADGTYQKINEKYFPFSIY